MSDIIKNKSRVGNFTSSQIWKLIKMGKRNMTEAELEAHKKENPKSRAKTIAAGFAAGGETYIKTRRQEAKRGRSMSLDKSSRSTHWGDFMEIRVFDLLGIEYEIVSQDTLKHPTIKKWTGSPDLRAPSKVAEIKCYEPEKFCDYADCLLAQEIDLFREDFPEEYWQIVSNAAITKSTLGEAILYMPYDKEAPEISRMVLDYDDLDIWKYQFIRDAIEEKRLHNLAFLPNDSGYPNLVRWEFEIPKEDIEFLTSRVKEAIALL